MRVGAGRLGRECVKDDLDELSLHSEWVVFRDVQGYVEKPHIRKNV